MSGLDYRRLWESRRSIAHFGERLSEAWCAEYAAATGASAGDLVFVDPGNGFSYTFDLAGSLDGTICTRQPRVVGVWGRSDPGRRVRDVARMRGHPRPARTPDDRGHLIALAAGGGYDINLVPMDAALNRGWTREGARFRDLERLAAAVPGSAFFVRLHYTDGTARPARLDAGVQVGSDLRIESFDNSAEPGKLTATAALRRAAAFPVEEKLVSGCLDPDDRRDGLFRRGWEAGPASLSRQERCSIAGVTGHVAESLAELLLDTAQWTVLWHFTGPGRHGVDLLFLAPDDKIVAVEVKGTLVPGRIPRLSRHELTQMSAEWIDKSDNPGMAELGLHSTDVYGAVVVVNFGDRTWRAALTSDFESMMPVRTINELAQLEWLDRS